MPIRFYCPFCDQLLGITRRKAGAVVECPSCQGKVGVPAEETAVNLAPGDSARSAPPPWLMPVPVPPDSPTRPDFVLSPTQVVAVLLAVVLMLCLSFAAGLLIGALV